MSSSNANSDDHPQPHEPRFPTHHSPRTWLISCAGNPIGLALCKHALEHGDQVVAGLNPAEFDEQLSSTPLMQDLVTRYGAANQHDRPSSLQVIALDNRIMSQCQAAVAEGQHHFGHIDILCCTSSESVIGTVEELGQGPRSYSLVQDQFERTFFGPVNIIKATLPTFRSENSGHIVLLSAVTGHLGTPGLSVYCASQWAIEGYCDSLAYEVAPFNIRVTIVQPNLEVNVLTNRITSAPPMHAYDEENNPAPLSRKILSSLLDKIEGSDQPITGDQLHSDRITSLYPPLTQHMQDQIISETVFAILAIAGHENPPARHIVGIQAIEAVKEKLQTVSEELEDFAECSALADVDYGQHTADD